MPLTQAETRELEGLEELVRIQQLDNPSGLLPEEERELKELERIQRLGPVQAVFDATIEELGQPLESLLQATRFEIQQGEELIRSGAERAGEGGVKDVSIGTGMQVLGSLQATLGPLTAAIRTFVGEPISVLARKSGIPAQDSKDIGTAAEFALLALGPGAGAKYVQGLLKEANPAVFGEAGKLIQQGLKGKKIEQVALKPGVLRQSIKDAPETFPLPKVLEKNFPFAKALSDDVTEEIAKAAEALRAGDMDASKRLFENVAKAVGLGEIEVSSLPGILKKFDMTPEAFARQYAATISTAGRQLAQLSRLKKQLNSVFADHPDALRVFSEVAGEPSAVDKVLSGWQSLESVRRAALVTQLATAMRNAWSQAGRVTISSFDEALQGVFKGEGGKTLANELRQSFNVFQSGMRRLSPKARQRLLKIMEDNEEIMASTRLISQPVHEAVGGKLVNTLNVFNRAQEFFFRKLAFEAKLRQLLSRRGLNFETVDPKKIPISDLREASQYGLEMSFASSPKTAGGRLFLKAWNAIPGMTLINPFPRFNFFNAIPFVLDHSPLGFLKAMSPKVLKDLATGNPQQFAKAASRATLGSLMLDSALRLRQSEFAGDRWYEVKVGDRVIDTRAFAPFSTYLFLAEAFTNPEKLKASDYALAMVGLNRVAGTGLVVTDLLRAPTAESAKKVVAGLAGQYLGSFTVPLRTAKDITAFFDPEEAILRDTRDMRILAPIIANIPLASQQLPEIASPVKGERVRSETPLLRQLTGLSLRTKTLVEKEVNRIQASPKTILPRTNVPEADRFIASFTGPIVEKGSKEFGIPPFARFIATQEYQALPDEAKRIVFGHYMRELRKVARVKMAQQNPELFMQYLKQGLARDVQLMIEETGMSLQELLQKSMVNEQLPEVR